MAGHLAQQRYHFRRLKPFQTERRVRWEVFETNNPSHQRVFNIQTARLLMSVDVRLGRLLDFAYSYHTC